MPPTMGMMMLSRMIMYFCGDPDSWDMRSLMIGMMGGMGGGMMGGMGGGMMGGMGGGMGGMGVACGRCRPPICRPRFWIPARPDICRRDWSASRRRIPNQALACPRRVRGCKFSATSTR